MHDRILAGLAAMSLFITGGAAALNACGGKWDAAAFYTTAGAVLAVVASMLVPGGSK